ncbi:MAG: LamG-like jellyroll fold domain-containing protein [Bacteroidota bacterium]
MRTLRIPTSRNEITPELMADLIANLRKLCNLSGTGCAVTELPNGIAIDVPAQKFPILVKLSQDWYACDSTQATILAVSRDADGKRVVSDTGQAALCDDPAGQITWDLAAVEDGFGGLYIPAGFYCTVWPSPNAPNGAYWLLHGGAPCELLGSGSGSGTPIKPKRCISIDQLCPPPADQYAPDGYEQPRWERQTDGCMIVVSCPVSSGSGSVVALGYPFDGSGNYYLTGDEDDLPTGTDQPMSFCVTTTGLMPRANPQAVLSWGVNGASNAVIGFGIAGTPSGPTGGDSNISIYTGTSAGDTGFTPPDAGTHVWLVTVGTDGNATLYMDGVAVATDISLGTPDVSGAGALYIGCYLDSSSQYLAATVSKIAIWNRDLGPGDVATATANPADVPSGLVRYWPLSDTSDLVDTVESQYLSVVGTPPTPP